MYLHKYWKDKEVQVAAEIMENNAQTIDLMLWDEGVQTDDVVDE
jgi:hypothetical protein